jgi:Kef-type K+ transport system membrane component KefB
MEEIVEVLWLALLLFCLWFFGEVVEKYASCPPLIAEIIVGCVLGPEVLNVVPEFEGRVVHVSYSHQEVQEIVL